MSIEADSVWMTFFSVKVKMYIAVIYNPDGLVCLYVNGQIQVEIIGCLIQSITNFSVASLLTKIQVSPSKYQLCYLIVSIRLNLLNLSYPYTSKFFSTLKHSVRP